MRFAERLIKSISLYYKAKTINIPSLLEYLTFTTAEDETKEPEASKDGLLKHFYTNKKVLNIEMVERSLFHNKDPFIITPEFPEKRFLSESLYLHYNVLVEGGQDLNRWAELIGRGRHRHPGFLITCA